MRASPGSLTIRSGVCRAPSSAVADAFSMKSHCSSMPASSTMRRSWISPHLPRTFGDRSERVRPSVAARSCSCDRTERQSCDDTAWNDPSRALSTSASWVWTRASVSRTGSAARRRSCMKSVAVFAQRVVRQRREASRAAAPASARAASSVRRPAGASPRARRSDGPRRPPGPPRVPRRRAASPRARPTRRDCRAVHDGARRGLRPDTAPAITATSVSIMSRLYASL